MPGFITRFRVIRTGEPGRNRQRITGDGSAGDEAEAAPPTDTARPDRAQPGTEQQRRGTVPGVMRFLAICRVQGREGSAEGYDWE